MKIRTLLFVCVALASPALLLAQTPDPFERMLRRMDEQMNRMMQPDSFLMRPDSTMPFIMKDTVIDGMHLNYFYFGGPMQDMNDLFGQFFMPFGPGMPGKGNAPADDGNAPPDLLPEERLRQEPAPADTLPPPPASKPKRSTVRI